MQNGKVVAVKRERGFAFVETLDTRETFFTHFSKFVSEKDFEELRVGDRVQFVRARDTKGRSLAVDVVVEVAGENTKQDGKTNANEPKSA
jgi:cold shock CspA family protein